MTLILWCLFCVWFTTLNTINIIVTKEELISLNAHRNYKTAFDEKYQIETQIKIQVHVTHKPLLKAPLGV